MDVNHNRGRYSAKMNKEISKRELELLCICLGLSLIIIGVMMNYIVINSNNCLMPVSNSPDADFSIKHINFNNYTEVKFPYLSDIIGWENNKFSLGDLFILIGICITIGFVIRYLIKLRFTPSSD